MKVSNCCGSAPLVTEDASTEDYGICPACKEHCVYVDEQERAEAGVLPNKRSAIDWTPYLATAYAEGFCEGENASAEEQIEAWAYLIVTGMCWSLQGWFGRAASDLIRSGVISDTGTIDWNKFNSHKN